MGLITSNQGEALCRVNLPCDGESTRRDTRAATHASAATDQRRDLATNETGCGLKREVDESRIVRRSINEREVAIEQLATELWQSFFQCDVNQRAYTCPFKSPGLEQIAAVTYP